MCIGWINFATSSILISPRTLFLAAIADSWLPYTLFRFFLQQCLNVTGQFHPTKITFHVHFRLKRVLVPCSKKIYIYTLSVSLGSIFLRSEWRNKRKKTKKNLLQCDAYKMLAFTRSEIQKQLHFLHFADLFVKCYFDASAKIAA